MNTIMQFQVFAGAMFCGILEVYPEHQLHYFTSVTGRAYSTCFAQPGVPKVKRYRSLILRRINDVNKITVS